MPSRAGSPNKNKGALKRRLKERFGDDFDIVETMATNAMELQKLTSHCHEDEKPQRIKLALDAWEKVAQFVEPKLKATEITTIDEDGEVTGFKVSFNGTANKSA